MRNTHLGQMFSALHPPESGLKSDITPRPFRATSGLLQCIIQCFSRYRLRSAPELGDGVTIVPRAEAFGDTIQDFEEAVPCSLPVIDSHKG
jgi:hypothetical protein